MLLIAFFFIFTQILGVSIQVRTDDRYNNRTFELIYIT